MKRIVMPVITGVLFLLLSCQSNTNIEADQTMTFKVIQPIVLDTATKQTYVCDIHSINNVEIRSRVKGYIESIYVDEGNFVKKGQLLFKISSQEYKEELLKAKAMLKSAIAEAKTSEIDLKNAEMLAEKDIVSKTEVEMAKAKLEAANAKVDEAKSSEYSAQLKLSYCEISAPFDGFIDRIPNKMGSLLDEGHLVTTLSDNYQIFAYFNVSEREYLNYMNLNANNSELEKVRLILANNEMYNEIGQIETIDGQFDAATGTIAFRARFNNPSKLLKHGASGKIELTNKELKALIIPQKTTFEVQDKIYVYVLNTNDEVELRPITIKNSLSHLYIIAEGLSPNDRILYEGIQLVKAGAKIKVEPYSMKDFLKELKNI